MQRWTLGVVGVVGVGLMGGALVGCADGGPHDFALPVVAASSTAPMISALAGPAGGTIETADVRLEVPQNSLDRNMTLSIQPASELAFGASIGAGPGYRLEPYDETLAGPVRVTIPYDTSRMVAPDTPSDLVGLQLDNRTARTMVIEPVAIDTNAHTITFELAHLSTIQAGVRARPAQSSVDFTLTPAAGFAPNVPLQVSFQLRNRLREEFGGQVLSLSASGAGNTFSSNSITTDLQGVARFTFQTTEAGSKTVFLSDGAQVVATLELQFGLPPVTSADTGSTDEDAAFTGASVLTNDTDADSPMLSAVAETVSSTLGAQVVIQADGTYTYDPTGAMSLQALAQGGSADDTFTYRASDGLLQTPGLVTVTVSGRNDAPVAAGDVGAASEDASLNGATVLANDVDVDAGTTLTAVAESISSAEGASVVVQTDGTYTYDPTSATSLQALAEGAQQVDTFSYQVGDGLTTVSAVVTVTVTGVNDLPTLDLNGAAAGADLSAAFTEDTGALTLAALALVDDVDTASLTSLAVTLSNPLDGADEVLAATTAGTSLTATYFASSSRLQLEGLDTLANYQAVLRTVTYANASDTPDTTDRTLVVVADDGVGTSSTATITLSVTPSNDAPTALATSGQTFDGRAVELLLTGTDPEGDPLTFSIGAGPSDGSLGAITPLSPSSASVVYTADMGFSGADSFTFVANDGSVDSAAATVSLTVSPLLQIDGVARFADRNQNKLADAGDTLVIPFDGMVPAGAALGDFDLPVSADAFGAGAIVAAGPGATELTVTLGASATLRIRGIFDAGDVDAGSPSGVGVAVGPTLPAEPTSPTDLVPGFDVEVGLGGGGDRTTAIGAADMDGDGDLDVYVANDGGQNQVLLNDGSRPPTLGNPVSVGPGNDATTHMVHADVDRDGDLDLIVTNRGEQDRVYLNDGNQPPAFAAFVPFGPPTSLSAHVAPADVDGDGDVDLVVGADGGQNAVYFNDGNRPPSFAAAQSFGPATDATQVVVAADVDLDGDVDLVVGNDGEQNVVYFNDGAATPTFPTSEDFGTGSDATTSVVVADADGDGPPDLFVGNRGQANVVYFNSGDPTPTFGVGQSVGTGSDQTTSLDVADFDRDGDLDVVVGNQGGPNVVYFSDGNDDPTFGLEVAFGPGDDPTLAVSAVDVDLDGDVDVLVGNDNAPNAIHLNSLLVDGALDFTESVAVGGALDPGFSIVLADADNDGDVDLATTGLLGSIFLDLLAVEDLLSLLPSITISLGGITQVRDLQFADMNGDGALDLVVANDGGQNEVLLSDGASPPDYSTSVDWGTGLDDTRAVAVADVDGDGDLDLVAGNDGEQNVVYLNDGNATPGFATSVNVGPTNDSTTALLVRDMDGDGDLDVVVGNDGEQNVVYLNDGNATPGFAVSVSVGPTNDDTSSLAASDLDRDGDLDLVVGNDGTQDRVYLNDGNATPGFAASVALGPSNSNTTSLDTGDFDGDGDVDVVVGVRFQFNAVYLNDGGSPPGFATSVSFGPGSDDTRDVTAFDFDRDGDLDVAVANQGQNRVYLND